MGNRFYIENQTKYIFLLYYFLPPIKKAVHYDNGGFFHWTDNGAEINTIIQTVLVKNHNKHASASIVEIR